MKTKFLILLILSVFIYSCDEDDNDNSEVVLTESNYIYEGDIYKQFLTDEITVVEEEIVILQDIIDNGQGDNQTQIDLGIALQQREELNTKLSDIVDLVSFGIIPFPPLPQPCPQISTCFPIDINFIATLESTTALQINIFDDQNQLIASSNPTLIPLPNHIGEVKYQNILVLQYTGEISIEVEKTDSLGNTIVYETRGFIYN
jgi:hypothetical protein